MKVSRYIGNLKEKTKTGKFCKTTKTECKVFSLGSITVDKQEVPVALMGQYMETCAKKDSAVTSSEVFLATNEKLA